MEFTIAHEGSSSNAAELSAINPTNDPSRIIDVGQWITLAHMFFEQAGAAGSANQARITNLKAAQCLDEALKFYDDPVNDLPPADALFSETSRARFREAPQQFSRQRLLSQRRKLPLPLKPNA